ncbi:MAG: PQQ-binding-like beta-propeller repeat protein [Candidatus Woesearchaeota archaeon]
MGIQNLIKRLTGQKRGKLVKTWEFQADSSILTSPAVGDLGEGKNVIVFGTEKGKIYTLDEQSKVKWLYDLQQKREEVELLFLDEETVKSIRCPPILADINNDGKKEIIVGSDSGLFVVISDTGKLLWDFTVGAPIRASALVEDLDNDNQPEIIFGCTDQFLYILDNKGKLLSKFKADSPIQSPCTVLKKNPPQIIFGSDDGTIYSLNRACAVNWKYKTNDKVLAQPAIADINGDGKEEIVVGSLDSTLYVLDESGALLWKFQTEGSIYSKACLADINNDGKLEIIFGSCDNNVYVLSYKGDKIWNYETDFWIVASPFVTDFDNDGKLEVVVGSFDHSLYILDAEGSFILNYMPGVAGIAQQPGSYADVMTSQPGQFQGKKLWQYKTNSFIVGSKPMENKGQNSIIVGTKAGKLKLFSHEKD